MGGPRLIDAQQRERKTPMRVIVLGLSRTGTASICAALRKLGYNPYQMRNLLTSPDSFPLWEEAIRLTLLPTSERPRGMQNRSIFRPYGREEFDALLGEHDAVADLPAALFPEQLIEAYPEAKIIVTTKPYEEWEASMQDSIWLLLTWRMFGLTRKLGVTQMAPLTRLMHLVFRVHNGNHYGGPEARKAYEKYYDDVRALVPAHRRLEIPAGEGEWGPLCEFLGHEKAPVEGTAYPNMDEGASMARGLTSAWWDVVRWFFMTGLVICVALLGVAAIYWADTTLVVVERGWGFVEPYVSPAFLAFGERVQGVMDRIAGVDRSAIASANGTVGKVASKVVNATVGGGKSEL
jgi:hypothetical protein